MGALPRGKNGGGSLGARTPERFRLEAAKRALGSLVGRHAERRARGILVMLAAMIGSTSPERNRSASIAFALLVPYALLLYVAQHWTVGVFDDEAVLVSATAVRSPAEFLRIYLLEGQSLSDRPPLGDILVHLWLRLTAESRSLLRVPSILYWCVAVGLIGATAQQLFGRRLLAMAIAMAWPPGLFLATPVHHSLAMPGVAASTWAYFRWRARGDGASAALFAVISALLFCVNYFGLAFVGLLGLRFLLSRPDGRAWRQGVGAAAGILAGTAPLLPAFFLAKGVEP
jgi:hypothetical protein